MKKKSVSHDEIRAMMHFIEYEINKLKMQLNHPDQSKIVIMLPNWITMFFVLYNREQIYNYQIPLADFRFFGVKTQPNCLDEIVVFYEDYHYDPERFKPAIYLIRFEIEKD